MKIMRYSVNGFKSQYQSEHLKTFVHYHLYDFDINIFPEHLKYEIQKIHNEKVPFYTENYEDFKYGIWAFIDGYKNNSSLNHLKYRVPCWTAEISDNTIGYNCNWDKKIKITDEDAKCGGIYIPKSQLVTLSNIQRKI